MDICPDGVMFARGNSAQLLEEMTGPFLCPEKTTQLQFLQFVTFQMNWWLSSTIQNQPEMTLGGPKFPR